MNTIAWILLISALIGTMYVWSAVLIRRRKQLPIIAQRPVVPARWGFLGIGFGLAIWLFCQFGIIIAAVAGYSLVTFTMADPPLILFIIASSSAWLCGMFACAGLFLASGAGTLRQMGFFTSQAAADVRLGLLAFFALTPLVLLLSMLLHWAFEPDGLNPLVDLLTDDAPPLTWLVSLVAAVLIAPIAEEFFFRGILQGGLEGLTRRGQQASLLAETPPEEPSPSENPLATAPLTESPVLPEDAWRELPLVDALSPDATNNPYQVHHDLPANRPPVHAGEIMPNLAEGRRARWGPIIVSSLVFSVAHWGNALDPIPLFGFALALGYIYQRTQSLLPCIVLHAANNGFSLLLFWLTLDV